jgi:23S rRNA pseudouridine1911/1915/1917 synthase
MSSEENSTIVFHPAAEDAGKRLDAFLAEKIEKWSRSRLKKLIDDGDVQVNEKPSKASYKLSAGDTVEVELAETPAAVFEPEDIPLNIVYEDEHLIVIDKPAGMVVHPGAGVSSGTLANALAYRFKIDNEKLKMDADLDEQARIDRLKSKVGIVHRLDKDTSGLIVAAKTQQALESLSAQFQNREVFKSYVALVHGEMDEDRGTIDAPIAREKHNRTKMGVRAHGRPALSLWKVKKRFDKFTLIEVEIKTGRTHQIRVHCAYINHPVVGDETYNAGRDKSIADVRVRYAVQKLNRFFLHAHRLGFTHPASGEFIKFTSPLPEELMHLLELLEEESF